MLPLDYHKTILVISLQGMNGNFHGREVNQKANKIAEPKKRLLLILIITDCWRKIF